jgi:hypothetical protein
MSEQTLAVVEALYAGAADADKQTLLAALPELIAQACDPEIEWVEDPQRADGKVYRGHAGVQESFEQWLEHFDEFGYEAERFIDCGEDVLVVGREPRVDRPAGRASAPGTIRSSRSAQGRSCATGSSTTSRPRSRLRLSRGRRGVQAASTIGA